MEWNRVCRQTLFKLKMLEVRLWMVLLRASFDHPLERVGKKDRISFVNRPKKNSDLEVIGPKGVASKQTLVLLQ